MAQITVSLRMDEQLKNQADLFCDEVGMSLSTAITVCLKKIIRERRFPFEVGINPDQFYSESNMRHLEKGMREFAEGKPGIVKTMEELETMADE